MSPADRWAQVYVDTERRSREAAAQLVRLLLLHLPPAEVLARLPREQVVRLRRS